MRELFNCSLVLSLKDIRHKREVLRELSTGEKRERKGFFSQQFFLSDQPPSDRVSRFINRWVGLKFLLSVLNILVFDLNGADRIWRCERSSFGTRTVALFWVIFFLVSFVGVAIASPCLAIVVYPSRRLFVTLLLL